MKLRNYEIEGVVTRIPHRAGTIEIMTFFLVFMGSTSKDRVSMDDNFTHGYEYSRVSYPHGQVWVHLCP
jgi:predicted neutral ceramidase superfamily lipid hydrolase